MNNVRRKLTFFILIYFFFFPDTCLYSQVKLTWNPVFGPHISHYHVYRKIRIDDNFEIIGSVKHPGHTFEDHRLRRGDKYFYVVTTCDVFGNESGFSNMVDTTMTKIKAYFTQNFPNPFNAATKIIFSVSNHGRVEIEILNILGQQVKLISNKPMEAGIHEIVWDGTDNHKNKMPSGIYFCRINTTTEKFVINISYLR